DIPRERLEQYKVLVELFAENQSKDQFILQLKMLFKILSHLSNGEPSNHFEIDFKEKRIKNI
ncbi:hypothetical protein QWI17_09940, partial [Gilvimarinus sp. SDUM040013]